MSFDLSNPDRELATEKEIEEARARYGGDDIEIDDDAKVSVSSDEDDPGIWVEGWLWLSSDNEVAAGFAAKEDTDA